jgi:4-hydroxy-tetrahydrodipicolinate synthase
VDNIVGIKDATGNMAQAAKMIHLCDGNIEVYSGEDGQVLPLLSIGGLGVISVLSNIAPRQTHDMVMEYLEGDRQKAMKIQLDATPLINALFCEVNPIPVKAAMNMLGMPAGPLRAPLYEMEDANKAVLRQELINFGLLK